MFVRWEYRDVWFLECMEIVVILCGCVLVDLVVIWEFRNVFMCFVFMVSYVWLVMNVEEVFCVNLEFRLVNLI